MKILRHVQKTHRPTLRKNNVKKKNPKVTSAGLDNEKIYQNVAMSSVSARRKRNWLKAHPIIAKTPTLYQVVDLLRLPRKKITDPKTRLRKMTMISVNCDAGM